MKHDAGELVVTLAILGAVLYFARYRPPAVIVIPPNEPLRAPARLTFYPARESTI